MAPQQVTNIISHKVKTAIRYISPSSQTEAGQVVD